MRPAISIKDITVIGLLLVCSAGAALAAVAGEIPLTALLVYTAGSLYYILFSALTLKDPNIDADYMQTGEGIIAAVAFYGALQLLPGSQIARLSALFIILLLFELYIKNVLSAGNDLVINGIITYVLSVMIFIFFSLNGDGIDLTALENIAWGHAASQRFTYPATGLFIAGGCLLLLIYRGLQPSLSIYFHGKGLQGLTGMNYNPYKVAIPLLRAVMMTATLFFIGLLGGMGYYIMTLYGRSWTVLKALLTLFVLLVVYSIVEQFISGWYIILFSVFISYILYIIYRIQRIRLYDRH